MHGASSTALLLLTSALAFAVAVAAAAASDSPYEFTLRLSPELTLLWRPDYSRGVLQAEVEFRPRPDRADGETEWVAVGFSDRGELTGADLCLLWDDGRGNKQLTDGHTSNSSTLLRADRVQDCDGPNFVSDDDGGLVFAFERRFDTCDQPDDYKIEDGTTHVVWSVGRGPLEDGPEGVDIADDDNTEHGFSRVRLLKVEDLPTPDPTSSASIDIAHEIVVPGDDTTYWCSVHQLPEEFRHKHHVTQYEPVFTPGNEALLHHMEVFHCEDESDPSAEFPLWAGPCGSDSAPSKLKKCKKVLAAWALGAGPFVYPREAGLAVGGENFGRYVMLEVHYNNQDRLKGRLDRSGLRLTVTRDLRPFDAGIMELGLVYGDATAIPPGQEGFALSGHCVAQCTEQGLPDGGVTIFGSQLHTHGSGIRVATRHFREGRELAEVNRDDHYSTHFQEIRALHQPRRVLPGDNLVTTCWHDTRDRANVTLGGYGFDDEMCVNYVHYYPRADLEVCKSAADAPSLSSLFDFWRSAAGQATDGRRRSNADNYRAVEWNERRARELADFYSKAELRMQCQGGDGEPLPGRDWSQGVLQPEVPDEPEEEESEECKAASNNNLSAEKRIGFSPRAVAILKARGGKRMGFNPKAVAILKERSMGRSKRGLGSVVKRVGFSPKNVDVLRQIYQAKVDARSKMGKKKRRRRKREGVMRGYLERLLRMEKRGDEVKRVGSPMNEMKRSGEPFNEMKRSGEPFNEMKKRRKREDSRWFKVQPRSRGSLMRMKRPWNSKMWQGVKRAGGAGGGAMLSDLEGQLGDTFGMLNQRRGKRGGREELEQSLAAALRMLNDRGRSKRSLADDGVHKATKRRFSGLSADDLRGLSYDMENVLSLLKEGEGGAARKRRGWPRKRGGATLNFKRTAGGHLDQLEDEYDSAMRLINGKRKRGMRLEGGGEPEEVEEVPDKRGSRREDLSALENIAVSYSREELARLEEELSRVLAFMNQRFGDSGDLRLTKRGDLDDDDDYDYTSMDREIERDLANEQWADYDSWGLDKRGLGSIV